MRLVGEVTLAHGLSFDRALLRVNITALIRSLLGALANACDMSDLDMGVPATIESLGRGDSALVRCTRAVTVCFRDKASARAR